ncbi:MAG: type II secretion system protein [Planctomycetia bacterium]|nr:type II secretion system protein [Planctomycetia bacterium]
MASRMPNRALPPRRHAPSGFAPGFAPGFTLVELLMVILIIGMLMALLITAVFTAKRTAEQARVTIELNSLGDALTGKYKDKRGEYPPDFAERGVALYQQQVILLHFRRAFPRWPSVNTASWANFVTRVNGALNARGNSGPGGVRRRIETLEPPEALVFFLGGIPRFGTAEQLDGFNADPANPFIIERPPTSVQRTEKMFAFDQTRLADRDGDGWPEYYPPGTSTRNGAPYVYFAARPGFPLGVRYGGFYQLAGIGGRAMAYTLDEDGNGTADGWVNPESFQIIAAGYDNDYGLNPFNFNAPRLYPTGNTYGLGDLDNLTSFSRSTLDDAKTSK